MSFEKYRSLPNDPDRGVPGPSYWTIPVTLPLSELKSLKAFVREPERLRSIETAMKAGVKLPPIEVGVFDNGDAWVADGNHRLAAYREAKRRFVEVAFAFLEV